jgi:hypothetical protein
LTEGGQDAKIDIHTQESTVRAGINGSINTRRPSDHSYLERGRESGGGGQKGGGDGDLHGQKGVGLLWIDRYRTRADATVGGDVNYPEVEPFGSREIAKADDPGCARTAL